MAAVGCERTQLVLAKFACLALIVTMVCVAVGVTGLGAALGVRAATDSAAAPVSALLAYLLYGRFRESRLVADAVLSTFLLLVALSNLLLSSLPRVLDQSAAGAADRSALAGVLAGALFAAAMWLPGRQWRGSLDAAAAWIVMLAAVCTLVAQVAGTELADQASGLLPFADPNVVATQLGAAGLFLVGAWGCARQPTFDRCHVLVAGAAMLFAVSRLDIVIATTPLDPWATEGLLLRFGGYVALVAAGSAEIKDYWRRMAYAAAVDERQRLSRDLHEGIAQDLAFAAGQARILARRSDHPERARLIIAAADRALEECRFALTTLQQPPDEPLHVTLSRCAGELCDRFQTRLALDMDTAAAVTPDVRRDLVRIVREAVGNAGQHGRAANVAVRLRNHDGLLLQVQDDGLGFDTDATQVPGQYGLISMQERAEALGGTFAVRSSVRGGTTLEVRLP